MTSYTAPLRAAGGSEGRSVAGAKAHRLALALENGFAVPDGFVVTTAAFGAFLGTSPPGSAAPLGVEIAARVAAAASGDVDLAVLARLAAEIGNLVSRTPLPAGVEAAIRGAYAALGREFGAASDGGAAGGGGGPAVAVRSSAPEEDGEGRSLAGRFESFLDVRGADDVVARVRACFASCWSERSLAHALRHKEGTDPRAMAVLVQTLIRPDAAGILFTREPLAPAPAPPAQEGQGPRMLVEIAPGLGHDVASGLVSPARYRVDRATRQAERLGGAAAELSAPLAAGLVTLAGRAEELFGGPQDIEWAVRGGTVFLLQARPITAVLAPGAQLEGAQAVAVEGDLWTAANSQEALEGPISPLTFTFLYPMIDRGRAKAFELLGVAEPPPGAYLRRFDGQVYFNVRYFKDFLGRLPGIPTEIFDRLIFGERPGAPSEMAFPRPPFTLRFFGLAVLIARTWWQAGRRLDAFVARYTRRLDELSATELKRLDDLALLAFFGRVAALLEEALNLHVLGTALAGGHYLVLAKFLGAMGVGGEGNVADELLVAAEGMETARCNLRLIELAETARRDPSLREVFLGAPGDLDAASAARLVGRVASLGPAGLAWKRDLDAFLDEFGHRGEDEADLMAPRWREDASFVIRTIGCFIAAGGPDRDPAGTAALRRREKRRLARRIERDLDARGRVLGRVVPWRRTVFRLLVRFADRYAPYRENLRFHALKAFARVRDVFLELGRRLAGRKLLARPEDVFFLEYDEVRALLPGEGARGKTPPSRPAELAAARRAEHQEALLRDPPKLLDALGRPVAGPAAGGPSAGAGAGAGAPAYLEGAPVSGGLVTGPVRKIDRLEEARRLRPGDILLARAATPSWTPLFFMARGVILDIGGVLSHCAVIAREYGIPCVVGVHSATSMLRDGDVVTLDADRGRVYLPARGEGEAPSAPHGPS